jgi:hypothetical protein
MMPRSVLLASLQGSLRRFLLATAFQIRAIDFSTNSAIALFFLNALSKVT